MLPEAFLQRMESLLGEEYPAFRAGLEEDRAFGLRANLLKVSPEELTGLVPFPLEPVAWAKEGFYYREEDRPGRHPLHEAGLYYIQEPSAMSAAAILDPKPGERVLDLCAAPGGKTTHLAGRMQGKGLLIANEIIPNRAKILAQNLERLGVSNAVVLNEDSGRLAERLPGFFDKILVDAPCSGEGMFRKDPDACDHWSPENVRMCADRQLMILQNAVKMLRPGGKLVYSTCTFSPEENEGSVKALLEAEPEMKLIDTGLGEFFSPGHPEWVNGPEELRKTVRIWPHKVRGEGHFAALFEKSADASSWAEPSAPVPCKDKTALEAFRNFCKDALTVDPLKSGTPILFGSELYRIPEEGFDLAGLKVARPGLHMGTLKKNRFEPAHALCLALKKDDFRLSADFPSDGTGIASFLRGGTLNADLNGWLAVLSDGYPIGWGKASGGIIKNHYPKGLRIMG